MKSIAIFPGSFDPPTIGHIDIIKRASALYDKLYVVVSDNIAKKSTFSADERVKLIKDNFLTCSNIIVLKHDGLTVKLANELNANVMIRGVRSSDDFSYELELAMINKKLSNSVETMFMITDPEYLLISSSNIKEMASYGVDISPYVPENVKVAIEEKFKKIF